MYVSVILVFSGYLKIAALDFIWMDTPWTIKFVLIKLGYCDFIKDYENSIISSSNSFSHFSLSVCPSLSPSVQYVCLSSSLIYWASLIFCLTHTCTNTPSHTLTHTLARTNTHALAHTRTRTRTETHTHKQLMVIGAVCRTTDKLPCHLHTTNSRVISLYVCCFVVVVNRLLCHLHTTNSDELFLSLCVCVLLLQIYFFAIFTQQIQIFLCVFCCCKYASLPSSHNKFRQSYLSSLFLWTLRLFLFYFIYSLTCIHPLQYNYSLSLALALSLSLSLSLIHISKVKYKEK